MSFHQQDAGTRNPRRSSMSSSSPQQASSRYTPSWRFQQNTNASKKNKSTLLPSYIMSLPIKDDVKVYMHQAGDKHVLLCCMCLKVDPLESYGALRASMSGPRQHGSSAPRGSGSGSNGGHVRKHTVPCGSMSSGEEVMVVVGNKHLYILPHEKIPLDSLCDLIGHVSACSAPFPTLEINIRHSTDHATGTFQGAVRFLLFKDVTLFQHCVDVLRSVALNSRYMIHCNTSRSVVLTQQEQAAAAGGADVSSLGGDGSRTADGVDTTNSDELLVANNRLLNFRRRKEVFSSVSRRPHVELGDYSENYGRAAEDLAEQITELIDQVSGTIAENSDL